MKFLLFIFLSSITVKGFSQEKISTKEPENLKYAAKDSIVNDDRNKILSLYGEANFQVDQLNVIADKVVFNRKSKEILVTGLKSYTFPYKIKSASGSRKRILRYKLGSDTVFID